MDSASVNETLEKGIEAQLQETIRFDLPKMSFLGCDALHGLVVRVKVRVIVDFQSGRVESRSDLNGAG